VQHSTLIGGHQGGQVPGSQWSTSLRSGVLHTGHPVPGGVYVPQPTFPLQTPPPSQLHILYTTTITTTNNNNNNNNNNNTLISHEDKGTFTCDGVVHPVLASQTPQPLPPAQAPAAPLIYARYDSIHAPLAAPYSPAPPAHEVYAPPLHESYKPFSLSIDWTTCVANLDTMSIAGSAPNGLLSEASVPADLLATAVANTVRLLVINATRVGNRFFCPIVGCLKVHVGSKDSLKHHLHRIHFKPSKRLQCPEAGCNISFGYYLELNRHHDQFHMGIGHECKCTGQWYRRLETLKKRCRLGSKCLGAVDRRAAGVKA
ncbi:hypothetical protein BGZ59_002437, partial [Podila verticillata]